MKGWYSQRVFSFNSDESRRSDTNPIEVWPPKLWSVVGGTQ